MKKLVTLLFIVITNILFGQDSILIKKFDKLESLVNKQTSSTKDLRLEEKKLVDRIDKLIEVYDSVSSQNMVKNEEFENQISSNTTSIDLIKNKKPDKKQNSLTDWLKAMAVIGTILSIYNFYSQKIKRLNELEKYLKLVIQGLYKPIEDQASSLLVLSKNLSDNNFKEATLENEPSLNFDNIDKIDRADLYKIFISNRKANRKDKAENFIKLEDAINRIKFIKNSLMTNYQNCFKRLNYCLPLWNQNLNKIFDYRRKMIVGDVKLNTDFLIEFEQLYGKFPKQEDSHVEPKIGFENFIDPLLKLCEEHYKNNTKAEEIYPFTKGCKNAFYEMKSVSKDYKDVFEKNSIDLLQEKEKIKKSLDNLLKTKRVNWLFRLFS